jgi:hypothetical protein
VSPRVNHVEFQMDNGTTYVNGTAIYEWYRRM